MNVIESLYRFYNRDFRQTISEAEAKQYLDFMITSKKNYSRSYLRYLAAVLKLLFPNDNVRLIKKNLRLVKGTDGRLRNTYQRGILTPTVVNNLFTAIIEKYENTDDEYYLYLVLVIFLMITTGLRQKSVLRLSQNEIMTLINGDIVENILIPKSNIFVSKIVIDSIAAKLKYTPTPNDSTLDNTTFNNPILNETTLNGSTLNQATLNNPTLNDSRNSNNPVEANVETRNDGEQELVYTWLKNNYNMIGENTIEQRNFSNKTDSINWYRLMNEFKEIRDNTRIFIYGVYQGEPRKGYGFGFHEFRRFGATLYYFIVDRDEIRVQTFLNHTSSTETRRYIKPYLEAWSQ